MTIAEWVAVAALGGTGYMLGVGVTFRCISDHLKGNEAQEVAALFGGLFWPVILPALLGGWLVGAGKRKLATRKQPLPLAIVRDRNE